jgi:hypothetical protein
MIKIERYSASQLPADIIVRLNNHSLYTSMDFARLWKTMGGRDIFWVAVCGGEFGAILPGVEFHHGPFTVFQSMPNGLFMQVWFSSDDDRARESYSVALLDAIFRYGYAKIYLNDFYRHLNTVCRFGTLDCATTVVDLSDPGWRPTNRKTRAEIRKAEREGTRLEKFDVSRHFDRFLSLVDMSEERHGRISRYSKAFFNELAGIGERDNRVRWVATIRQDQLVASHIFFVDGASALWWQLYFDKAFSYAKPNSYTFYTIVHQLASEGVRHINLGTSPSGAQGIIAHKEKWGGERQTYPCYWKKSLIGKLW